MAPRKINLYKDYYFRGKLTDEEIEYIDKILTMENVDKLKNILQESAEISGRYCSDEYVLYDKQTIPVAISVLNDTLFIGDKPGLGKTVMGAAIYALYRKKKIEKGEKPDKLLFVTNNNNLSGIHNELKEMGVDLIKLGGGTANIEKSLIGYDIDSDETDGIVTSWDSLKINGFLMYYMDNYDKIKVGIFDESSAIKDSKIILYERTKEIRKNMEKVIFLNASMFETHINDIINQMKIMNKDIIPTKKFINERYVVHGRNSWFVTEMNSKGVYERKMRSAYTVDGYRNQEDLRKRLKYFYISRSKRDFKEGVPENIYKLHPVIPTGEMKKQLEKNNIGYNEILNSPTTRDKKKKFTATTVPKLRVLIDLFESIADEKPVIYCFNREAQDYIRKHLQDLGYKIEIIRGGVSGEEREIILKKLREGELDGIITNIEKSLNIYGSNAEIFYTIPNNPQIVYQIMGRIDRNNFDTQKSYHFLVYIDSPEMFNMVDLAFFREDNSNKFTGNEEEVFKQLIKQLERIVGEVLV